MIRCTRTGAAVSTDFMSSPDVFAQLRFGEMRLACPECGAEHVWSRADAFLEERPPRTPANTGCTADYRIDERLGIVLSQLSGRCTMEDVLDFRRRLHADPAYHPGMPVLIDARELTQVLPIRELHQLADEVRHGSLQDSGRRAIVTNSDLVTDRIRMFGGYAGGDYEYRVFTDVAGALAWLTGPAGSDGTEPPG